MSAPEDQEKDGPPAPRANPDLRGHEAAERTLLESFRSGRMPHAWLISGSRGVGKATLAYRFARFVLSQGGGSGGNGTGNLFADGTANSPAESLHLPPDHPVFRRIESGGHADFLGVERSHDPKTHKLRNVIVVEDVRGIGAFLGLTAAEGGWRVVVIDKADEMNPNAANAVLKVLEEPPSRALLLLVSDAPGRLLPTIRSRCRRLALKPLSEETVKAILNKHAPDTTEQDAAALARLAEGSAGRALDLAASGGLDLYRDVLGLLETLPVLDTRALHDLGDRAGRPGAGGEAAYHTLSGLLRGWLGRLIVRAAQGEKAGPPPAGEIVDGDEGALMTRLMNEAGLARWLAVWEKINTLLARADGGINLDRRHVILNVFLALENTVRP